MKNRRKHRLILFCALVFGYASALPAALVINPAKVISHEVRVQLIQTALDDGSSPVAIFGDAARRAAVEAAVDSIWAQAGIDVSFLPNVVRYNNTFAYQGALPATVPRPIQDLGAIMASAQLQGGILHPDPSVLNMIFVNIVPGFNLKGANWANGVGNIGDNGIAMFVGAGTSVDHAAHWVSHEIGHNLGLHHSDPVENLMLSGRRRSSVLTDEQISAIFQKQPRDDAIAQIPFGGTGFPIAVPPETPGDFDRSGQVNSADYALWRKTERMTSDLAADANANGVIDASDYSIWRANFGNGTPVPTALAGDYNSDGVVDAGDYVVWRKSHGSSSNLAADGNGNGIVDHADYVTWKSQFGKSRAASAVGMAGLNASVPEPTCCMLLSSGLALFVFALRRRRIRVPVD